MTTKAIDDKIEQIKSMGAEELEALAITIAFSPVPQEAKDALQNAVNKRTKQLPSISPEAVTSEITYD